MADNGHSEPFVKQVAQPTINEREREILLNDLSRRLDRQNELTENMFQVGRQWLAGLSDPFVNLWTECGWPVQPTTDQMRLLYERDPLATRVVEVYPKECWQVPPTVYEDMDLDVVTEFEQGFDDLCNGIRNEASWHQDEMGSQLWEDLQRADVLSRIGSYGVLLMGIDDGKNLQEPLDGVMVANAKHFGDSPMTEDEEHRLLNPQPRWKAVDQDERTANGTPVKQVVPGKEDVLGASPLTANQRDVLDQWRWERTYRQRGMSPTLATNAAKKRVEKRLREEGKLATNHVNPCPACGKRWESHEDPQDEGGICLKCGKVVPLVDQCVVNSLLQPKWAHVVAKTVEEAASLVQQQEFVKNGWWPYVLNVVEMGRGTACENANPEGHNQYTEGVTSAKMSPPKTQGEAEHRFSQAVAKAFGPDADAEGGALVHYMPGDRFITASVVHRPDARGDSKFLVKVDFTQTGMAVRSAEPGAPSAESLELLRKVSNAAKAFHQHGLGLEVGTVEPKRKKLYEKFLSTSGLTKTDEKLVGDKIVQTWNVFAAHWDDEPVVNADKGKYETREAKRTSGFSNEEMREPMSPPKRGGFDPTKASGASHPRHSRAPAEVFGTDRQYDDLGYGIGMPPPAAELGYSLSGTDEQYFGVQFGPSEQPAPPTDPGTFLNADGKPSLDGNRPPNRAAQGGTGRDGTYSATDQDGVPQWQKRRRPRLLFLRPYDESLVQIVRYEWNIRNPRFGYPVMYRITLNDPRVTQGGVGLPLATVFVHWSRVIHLCERNKPGGVSSSPIYSIPCLWPVFNDVVNAQKVTGAGATGYYKSCFTGLQFSTHPQMGPDVVVDPAQVKASLEDYQSGLTRGLLSVGGQWSTLAPSVVDPTPHYNLAVEKICIVLGCPVRIFKGSERGELASSQDDESWNKRRQERQVNYLTPRVIVPLIDRLIQVGVLPVPGQKDAKKQVNNLLAMQPKAIAQRVDGGWVVRNVHGKRKTFNTVSPSIGDAASERDQRRRRASSAVQAQKMAKDNQQRPGDVKDLQARTGQAGGPDAYSKPLTDAEGKSLEEATENAEWEKLAAKSIPALRKRIGVAAIKEELSKYTEDQLDGLGVWVNPDLGVAVIDRMDWYDKSRDGADPATAVADLAAKQWGEERVIEQNEGSCPKGSGWITLNSATHWDGEPVVNKPKVKKQPVDEHHPSGDYTSQPDSIGPADMGVTPGYDPPYTDVSHATGAKMPPPNAMGPSESKAHYEGGRYATDNPAVSGHGNAAQDTGGWEVPQSSDEADGGAQPWEFGQTGTMARQGAAAGAGRSYTLFVSDGGYSVEWPDIEAVGRKDKAAIALSYTQALSAYVQGGCEATMPFKTYLVHIWGWEEELAQEVIDAVKVLHDPESDEAPLTQPKMVAGQPAEAAEGTQAAADAQDAKDAAKAKADAMAKMKPAMAPGKQPKPDAMLPVDVNEDAEPTENALDEEAWLAYVFNWCNQYGGTTCKEGTAGYAAMQRLKQAGEGGLGVTPWDKGNKAVKHTVDSLHSEIHALRQRGDIRLHEVSALAEKISTMKVQDIKVLKDKLGEKATGSKTDMSKMLAVKALEARHDKVATPNVHTDVVAKLASPLPSSVELPAKERIARIVHREQTGGAPFVDMAVQALKLLGALPKDTSHAFAVKELQRQAKGQDPLHPDNDVNNLQLREALELVKHDFGHMKVKEFMHAIQHIDYPNELSHATQEQRKFPHDLLDRMRDL